eukprot:1156221-Pelagomonas_calceolata.AAC.3
MLHTLYVCSPFVPIDVGGRHNLHQLNFFDQACSSACSRVEVYQLAASQWLLISPPSMLAAKA